MNKLKHIYDVLLKEYGPQGWWPVTPTGGCKGEFSHKPVYGIKTRTEKQRFEIIIGAILTQNTAWRNAEKAIANLNKENLVDIRMIQAIDAKKLAELIRPAGYFNQKAERLKIMARHLYEKYNGSIKSFFNQETQKLRQELMAIKGIGPETADSVLLYAGDKPIFVIDTYTRRLFTNLGMIKAGASYDEVQALFTDNLPKDAKLFNEYHALIVEHAKKYYSKKDQRTLCPLYKKFVRK